MFKAIAQMTDGTRNWIVTIYDRYTNAMDAERAARRFARQYDNCITVQCMWVQVLEA